MNIQRLLNASRVKFLTFVFWCCAAGLSQAVTLTGSYTVDLKPQEMLFISLLQSGENLTGSMIAASPDDKGGTKSVIYELTGSTNDGALLLTAKAVGGSIIFNGKHQGGALTLTYPSQSGQLNTIVLIRSSEQRFNTMLSRWQVELGARYAEQKELDRLAKQVDDDLKFIRSSGIESDASSIRTALQDQKDALTNLEKDLYVLKRDASVRPMTCSQAFQSVASDFSQSMTSTFNQSLGSSVEAYKTIAARIEVRLGNGDRVVLKTEDDMQILMQALKSSKYGLRIQSIPKDSGDVIAKYKTIKSAVRDELPRWKTESDATVESAKSLMREGKTTALEAQSLVRCR